MFPLAQRNLIRGAAAHVAAGLGIGTDHVARYVELFAPFDGDTVSTFSGVQGGNWLRLKRPNGDVIEFAHLDRYIKKTGITKMGEVLAITGNTGQVTTGPHLHTQIFRNGQRIDPDKYLWNTVAMPTCEQDLAVAKETIRVLNTEVARVTQERDLARKQFADEKTSHANTQDVLAGTRTERDKAIADLKVCQQSSALTPEQRRILAWFAELKALL